MKLRFCVWMFMLVCSNSALAWEDWGNWRGPEHTGASESSQIPTNWNATENIRWKVALPGKGSSTPVVAGDKIFVTTAIKTTKAAAQSTAPEPEQEGRTGTAGRGARGRARGGRGGMNNPQPTNEYEFVVMALSRMDGSQLWQKTVNRSVPHEPGHLTNTYASGSPVTDGKHVYASFGSDGIYCLTMDGHVVWERQLGKMKTRNSFGEGASPALHDDTLIIPWDHDGYTDDNGNGVRDDGELDSCVYALDALSGETKWKTDRPSEPTTWATPLIAQHGGVTQVIMNGTTVRSYDLKDGRELWNCGGQVTNPIPCPVRFEDSVICMTGYRGNSIYSIGLDGRGDVQSAANWNRKEAAPYVASPALYDGVLYLTKSREGAMMAFDAKTGETIIGLTRLKGISDVYASPVAAGGHVYFTSRSGVTVVIEHGKTFSLVATNDLGEPVDASPVVLEDSLLIRSTEHLFCIGE